MIDWLLLLAIAAASTAIVLVPGFALGYVLRLRGIRVWGFAPAGGVAVHAVSATLLPFIGMPWNPATALVCAVILVALAAAAGRLLGQPARHDRTASRSGLLGGAIVLGAALGIVRMATILGHAASISQTNDATFHLNVLRFIGETGSASSLDVLGALGASGFYPAAWHSIASLLTSVGIEPALSANALSLAIAGPLWTLSITAYVWCATGGRKVAAIAAAVLSPTLFSFPFYMLDFGVLYPYALAVTLVPGVLAVLVDSPTGSPGTAGDTRARILNALIALVGLAAIGFAQPAGLLVWLIGAVALLVSRLIRKLTQAEGAARLRAAAALVVTLLGSLAIWLGVTSISSDQMWPPHQRAPRAALDLLLNSSAGPGPIITISVLALIGFWIAVRTPGLRWLALFGTAIALLTLVAVSVLSPAVRGLLAAWYADWHRFLALMPLIVIPFAAIGIDAAAHWIGRGQQRRTRIAAVALTALVVVEAAAWVAVDVRTRAHRYDAVAMDYLSDDERTLLEELPELVSADERVLGNPSSGAAFGYALSGRDVFPRTWSKPNGADFETLRQNLKDIDDDPAVCDAVERLEIDYVLDFGQSAEGPGKWDMPGLTGFAAEDGFEKVAQRGDASLWRITACD